MENGSNQNPYNNTNYQNPYNNAYYQNLYNMFGTHNPIIDQKASAIRRWGMLSGGACLAYVAIQYAFVLLLAVVGLIDVYRSDVIIQNCLNIFCSIASMLVPFLFVYIKSESDDKKRIMRFDLPKDIKLAILAVSGGLAICLASNIIGNIILAFFSLFGVEFSSGMEDLPVANNFSGYIITVLCYAFVPALIEEFAFRGIVLQPLRKYGDKFAIIISSIIFSLMHGNMIQIPTAFVSGLALGYFCIKTESIWTSVAIHFLNNLISSILTIYFGNNPDANEAPIMIIIYGIFAIGVVALILFFTTNRKNKLAANDDFLPEKLKRSIFLCSPTVIFAIIYSMYSTFTLQKITSALGMLLMIGLLAFITAIIVIRINLIKGENRISFGNKYAVSRVLIIATAVIGTLAIIVSTLVNGVAAQ